MSDELYKFAGGPIDAPDDATEVFLAIGHLAASWVRLEQHIDVLLVHINKGRHSVNLYDPDHPVSFKRKLALLKRWFNQHRALKPYADNMRVLMSQLTPLADDRNAYLHSILDAYDSATQMASFRSVKFIGNDTFRHRRQDVPLKGIAAVADAVNASNQFLWSMTSDFFTADVVKQLGKP